MTCACAREDLLAMLDVIVVGLSDHLIVRKFRLPVELRFSVTHVEVELAAIHQRVIIAERHQAESSGGAHRDLGGPERQRANRALRSGVSREAFEKLAHRSETRRASQVIRWPCAMRGAKADACEVIGLDELESISAAAEHPQR